MPIAGNETHRSPMVTLSSHLRQEVVPAGDIQSHPQVLVSSSDRKMQNCRVVTRTGREGKSPMGTLVLIPVSGAGSGGHSPQWDNNKPG